jgi:hypothetical protein
LTQAGEPRLAILSNGDVLLVTGFRSGAILGKGTSAEKTLVEDGWGYARFTSSLEFEAIHFISKAPVDSYNCSPLPDGSVVFVGRFSSSVTLGTGEPHEVTFKGDTDDGFVLRTDPEGQLMWATQITHPRGGSLTVSAALSDGSVWVGGGVGSGPSAMLTIAPGVGTPMTLATDESTSYFIARLTPDGVPAWIIPFEGAHLLSQQQLVASPSCVIYAGSKNAGTVTFGSNGPQLTGNGVAITRIGP